MEDGADQSAYERALHEELTRRVQAISSYPEDAFGALGRTDLVLIALACLVAPAFLLWWFR